MSPYEVTTETESVNEQAQFAEDRLEKVNELRENGYNPYRLSTPRTDTIENFIQQYESISESELTTIISQHTLSGRITRINNCGGLSFIDITNDGERVQTVFERNELQQYDDIELLDLGDVITTSGNPIRTNTGELSLSVTEFDVINKTLRHPNNEYNSMSAENQIRERAIALRGNELHSTIQTRFEMQSVIRSYLSELGYLEVETPILNNHSNGANAETFDTVSECFDQEMNLRIAPELHLKRLLVGGFNRIFEMGRVFRNEDTDTTHNPEFTMLELYETYCNYEDMMELVEQLVSHTFESVHGTTNIQYSDTVLDFSTPWRRIEFDDAISEYVPVNVHQMNDAELQEYIETINIELSEYTRGMAYMELYDEFVEPEIVQPTIVYNYPTESTPLCDTCEDDSRVERFEVVVSGIELANAYTELTDAESQLHAFEQQSTDEREINYDYVNDIAHGLPPSGGLGIGIDRLAMFLTDSNSIKDVIPFPMVSSNE